MKTKPLCFIDWWLENYPEEYKERHKEHLAYWKKEMLKAARYE